MTIKTDVGTEIHVVISVHNISYSNYPYLNFIHIHLCLYPLNSQLIEGLLFVVNACTDTGSQKLFGTPSSNIFCHDIQNTLVLDIVIHYRCQAIL